MRKRVSIYVRNSKIDPSGYYRVIQYIKDIEGVFTINSGMSERIFNLNLNINNSLFKKICQIYFYLYMLARFTYFLGRDIIINPDIVIIQRSTIPKHTPLFFNFLLRYLVKKTTLYWDFDDDIFINSAISKNQSFVLSKYSKKIIVTHEYLRNLVSPEYYDKVIVIPTTDGDNYDKNIVAIQNDRKKIFKQEIRLVWVGTSSNLFNLYSILEELDSYANIMKRNHGKNVVLNVVCNKSIVFTSKHLVINNILWSREIAANAIATSHIGIMPLLDNTFALGKGGFKLIQYMASGLPVVASSVGFNKSVVNDLYGRLVDNNQKSEWINSLLCISCNWDVWNKFSHEAHKYWDKEFSYCSNLVVWKNLIESESNFVSDVN